MRIPNLMDQKLPKTAALLFFLGLVAADILVAFFAMRSYLYPADANKFYLPSVVKATEIAPETSYPSPQTLRSTLTPLPVKVVDPTAAAETYVVQSGDTLFSIAQKYGMDLDQLVEINKIVDRDRIQVGQELIIQRPTPTPKP